MHNTSRNMIGRKEKNRIRNDYSMEDRSTRLQIPWGTLCRWIAQQISCLQVSLALFTGRKSALCRTDIWPFSVLAKTQWSDTAGQWHHSTCVATGLLQIPALLTCLFSLAIIIWALIKFHYCIYGDTLFLTATTVSIKLELEWLPTKEDGYQLSYWLSVSTYKVDFFFFFFVKKEVFSYQCVFDHFRYVLGTCINFLSPINTLGVFGFSQVRFYLSTELIILNMCA